MTILERLEQLLDTFGTERPPGQESVEEMREGVRRAARDYKDGLKNYITHDELFSKFSI